MSRLLQFIPEAQGEEFFYLEQLTEQMTENQLSQFAATYRTRRRDPQNVMLLTILGLIVIAGLQRFYVGQVGMGILYLLTGGLCLIGTIIDLINYKDLAWKHNQEIADEIVRMV